MKKNESRARFIGTALLGAVVAGGPLGSAAAAPAEKVSTANDRKEVGITIYNQNFGLVREVRDLDVGKGTVGLEFRDVASQIQPETVSIKSLAGAGALRVLEQNYRYDLLTSEKLLEKYVGQKVRIYRYDQKTAHEDAFDAEVLSVVEGRPVLRVNGEVTFDFPGRFAFPRVPENLIAKPTLVWLVDSGEARQKVEVSYLAENLNWKADYVVVLDAADQSADLTGWVTLTNQSGASYRNARLKLVAGEVQRVQPPRPAGRGLMMEAAAASAPQFKEEGFFEYHLYTLDCPADVLENEQKQVTLLEGKGVKVAKKLISNGQLGYFRESYGGGEVESNSKVGVFLDIQNTQANHLGIPLPKGTVRVYKADKSGDKQFVGEDTIDHTPRDEKVRVKVGEAFDVVVDRKQTEWRALGTCSSESAWEIEVRNHKDTAETVELDEPAGGDWQIVSSNLPATRKDASTFTFDVAVPAKGAKKVTYRVRVRWC
jgi:hypothetical protein